MARMSTSTEPPKRKEIDQMIDNLFGLWYMYVPDVELTTEYWNLFVENFMMSVNDNGSERLPPEEVA